MTRFPLQVVFAEGFRVLEVLLEEDGEHLSFPVSQDCCVGNDNGQQGNQKE